MSNTSLVEPLYGNFYSRFHAIAHILESKHLLLNDKLEATNKSGLRWVALRIAKPFYSFFGRDVFLHVRINNVIQKLQAYLDQNRQHLVFNCSTGKSLVNREDVAFIYNNIILPLNERTHKKYEAVLNQILAPYRSIQQAEDIANKAREAAHQARQEAWQKEFEESNRRHEEELKASRKAYETAREARQRAQEAFQARYREFEKEQARRRTQEEEAARANFDKARSKHKTRFHWREDNGNSTQKELEKILGCSITTLETLNSAYKQWARKNHPDKVPDERKAEATTTFQKVGNLICQLKASKSWK